MSSIEQFFWPTNTFLLSPFFTDYADAVKSCKTRMKHINSDAELKANEQRLLARKTPFSQNNGTVGADFNSFFAQKPSTSVASQRNHVSHGSPSPALILKIKSENHKNSGQKDKSGVKSLNDNIVELDLSEELDRTLTDNLPHEDILKDNDMTDVSDENPFVLSEENKFDENNVCTQKPQPVETVFSQSTPVSSFVSNTAYCCSLTFL